MRNIQVLEGKVVAPEGMRVAIVASRFNEIIVNTQASPSRSFINSLTMFSSIPRT